MSDELLKKATESTRKKDVPDFTVGDTVGVAVRIVEGDKERQQVFTGTVIARKGGGASETFTVRRIVNNEGVERVFPVHSPRIADIKVVRSAKTRRAKLYYLRDRVGKATRLKQAATRGTVKPQAPRQAEEPAGDEGEAAEQE